MKQQGSIAVVCLCAVLVGCGTVATPDDAGSTGGGTATTGGGTATGGGDATGGGTATGGGDATGGGTQQVPLRWTQRTPSLSPTPRFEHAMAFDATRGRLVLFGGRTTPGVLCGSASNETWEWDGTTWTLLAPTASPPGLNGHTMAYDSDRSRLVVIGGKTCSSSEQIWEYDGTTWSKRGDLAQPRVAHAMTYDAARRSTVVVGGGVSEFGNDFTEGTLLWNGNAWSYLSRFAPDAIGAAAMAFDAARSRTVLFGGRDANLTLLAFPQALGSAGWTTISSATPPARAWHVMAYDSSRRNIIVHGGRGAMGSSYVTIGDTWALEDSTWTNLTATAGALVRSSHAMAWDPVRERMVVFGGLDENGALLGDTWELAP